MGGVLLLLPLLPARLSPVERLVPTDTFFQQSWRVGQAGQGSSLGGLISWTIPKLVRPSGGHWQRTSKRQRRFQGSWFPISASQTLTGDDPNPGTTHGYWALPIHVHSQRTTTLSTSRPFGDGWINAT